VASGKHQHAALAVQLGIPPAFAAAARLYQRVLDGPQSLFWTLRQTVDIGEQGKKVGETQPNTGGREYLYRVAQRLYVRVIGLFARMGVAGQNC
jgi:hypothetical protein